MSFHYSNLGRFGDSLRQYADRDGYVPEDGDAAADFDFGDDRFTADFDDHGDGHVGYAAEAWAEHVAGAAKATAEAKAALAEWRAC